MTRYHRLGGLNNRNLFPYSSGGWRAKTKVPAGLVPGENPPWLTDGHFLTVSSQGDRREGGRDQGGGEGEKKRDRDRAPPLWSVLIQTLIPCNPKYLPKAPPPNKIISWVMASTCEFLRGCDSVHSVLLPHQIHVLLNNYIHSVLTALTHSSFSSTVFSAISSKQRLTQV